MIAQPMTDSGALWGKKRLEKDQPALE